MENNISVVKRLKYYFDILGKEFGSHLDLNKSTPKFNPYSSEYSKGVESDYIRIYKMGKINNKEYTFAFAITNPEDSEKSLIQVTYKIGEDILVGKIYKLEAFKEKMKEFVNLIAILKGINNKNSEAIKQSIHTIFEFDSQKLSNEEILGELKEKIAESVEEFDISLNRKEKLYNAFKTKREKISKVKELFKNKRIKELGIDKLENELKKLKDELIKDLKVFNLQYSDSELLLKERDLSLEISRLRLRKSSLEMNILKTYPSNIRKMYEKEMNA